MEYSTPLAAHPTTIPGMVVFDLPVHGDNRGWFKENWQRAKMTAVGLPDFGPVQNNISFNESRGTTRGIHAEPWDKFISIAMGSVFGAWVDLRQGPSFGSVFTTILDPSKAIYVPRGVGNAFQTLEDNTSYTYLVNDHWSAEAQSEYTFLNLADETVAIDWPVPLQHAALSEKDKHHPRLGDVVPMPPKQTLVLGANGQLGIALRGALATAGIAQVVALDHAELDLTDPDSLAAFDWRGVGTIINAAAFTDVDGAETDDGRGRAWAVNAGAVAALARVATANGITLVHVSSDYVFDGSRDSHTETEPYSPLGVYGQTKAAADLSVSTVPRHYIVRTSWVIGEGKNFVRTMRSLADRGVQPSVVNDQIGRLTFTVDLAAAIVHLLTSHAEYGIYNVTNEGPSKSWQQIAADVFALTGHDPAAVTGISTADYFAGKSGIAPRPTHSTLDLRKIEATGFAPRDARAALVEYLQTA